MKIITVKIYTHDGEIEHRFPAHQANFRWHNSDQYYEVFDIDVSCQEIDEELWRNLTKC